VTGDWQTETKWMDGCDNEITDTHITTFEVLTAATLCRWDSKKGKVLPLQA
jgi:hypothetical protein